MHTKATRGIARDCHDIYVQDRNSDIVSSVQRSPWPKEIYERLIAVDTRALLTEGMLN